MYNDGKFKIQNEEGNELKVEDLDELPEVLESYIGEKREKPKKQKKDKKDKKDKKEPKEEEDKQSSQSNSGPDPGFASIKKVLQQANAFLAGYCDQQEWPEIAQSFHDLYAAASKAKKKLGKKHELYSEMKEMSSVVGGISEAIENNELIVCVICNSRFADNSHQFTNSEGSTYCLGCIVGKLNDKGNLEVVIKAKDPKDVYGVKTKALLKQHITFEEPPKAKMKQTRKPMRRKDSSDDDDNDNDGSEADEAIVCEKCKEEKDADETYQMSKCKHNFCFGCIKKYNDRVIEDGKCLKKGCKKEPTESDEKSVKKIIKKKK